VTPHPDATDLGEPASSNRLRSSRERGGIGNRASHEGPRGARSTRLTPGRRRSAAAPKLPLVTHRSVCVRQLSRVQGYQRRALAGLACQLPALAACVPLRKHGSPGNHGVYVQYWGGTHDALRSKKAPTPSPNSAPFSDFLPEIDTAIGSRREARLQRLGAP